MATDDIDDYSLVSSSIFYAKKNSPEKQKILLNLSSIQTSVPNTKHAAFSKELEETPSIEMDTEKISSLEKEKKDNSLPKEKGPIYQPQQLSTYYSEIPPMKEVNSSFKKTQKKEKRKLKSPTRVLLTAALIDTKKRLSTDSKQQSSRKKTIPRKKMTKKDIEKIQEQTIGLNHFVSEKIVKIKEITKIQPEMKIQEPDADIQIQQESFLKENDPFPFTNLTEWLIWHQNYPELAFVRETYDLGEVPDDAEVFWVNVMNDPEFFNTNWQIVGSNVDIDLIKNQGRPDLKPEWDILSSLTDGFSTFFGDVYQILSQNSQGLQNYRYGILQFALKGLLLLDLAFFKRQKWFSKGSYGDLMTRLKELDLFISQQSIHAYHQNIGSLTEKDEWYTGLVSFDLISSQSTFLKEFSKNQLAEDTKIQMIKQEDLNQMIAEKLSMIEKADQIRIRNILRKLEVQGTTN
ncbi:MAG: hypothetical protein ACXADY_07150 [Candidatus Hodarchaeales archaeon]|jgi:hypothetical protein